MKCLSSILLIAFLLSGSVIAKKCPFKDIGIPCCKSTNKVVETNKYGNFGIERGKLCGIIDDSCWSLNYGYLCCTKSSTPVYKIDKYGKWGREKGRKCGIKQKVAQTLNEITFDEGGSGPFKAVMSNESGLTDFTIYRPKDLEKAVAKTGSKLPVILFANGGCAKISVSYANFLIEIASHGYVIAAVGPYAEKDTTDYGGMTLFFTDEMIEGMKVDADNLLDTALTYLEKENKDKSSIFYKTLNTKNVAAMGQSCGGLQALIIGTKNDKRIKTTVALNSGANSPGDLLDKLIVKDDLNKLTKPIIYVIGGEEDIAHYNAIDDYERINHVPVALACKSDAGHMGTYGEQYGGTFGKLTLKWLDYQLKKDKKAGKIFRDGKVGEDLEGWTIENKNLK